MFALHFISGIHLLKIFLWKIKIFFFFAKPMKKIERAQLLFQYC